MLFLQIAAEKNLNSYEPSGNRDDTDFLCRLVGNGHIEARLLARVPDRRDPIIGIIARFAHHLRFENPVCPGIEAGCAADFKRIARTFFHRKIRGGVGFHHNRIRYGNCHRTDLLRRLTGNGNIEARPLTGIPDCCDLIEGIIAGFAHLLRFENPIRTGIEAGRAANFKRIARTLFQ